MSIPAPDRIQASAADEVVFSYPLRREPLPRARRILVHDHVVRTLRGRLRREGFVEIAAPAPTTAAGRIALGEHIARGADAVYCLNGSVRGASPPDGGSPVPSELVEFVRRGLTLDGLCAFQETLLKDVLSLLHVDQIGGDNVTRLDRVITCRHARLSYREALAILARRGFALRSGDDLDREAQDMLVHHCGNLPVHLTHRPAGPAASGAAPDRSDPPVVASADYILPFSGVTVAGAARGADPGIAHGGLARAGAAVDVARLLQFAMGLESVRDAVALPPLRAGGRDAALEAAH